MWFYIIITLINIGIGVLILLKIQNPSNNEESQEIKTRLEVLRNHLDVMQKTIADDFERNRRDINAYQKDMRQETNKSLETIAVKLQDMLKENASHQHRLTETMSSTLNDIRQSNEKRLDEMRQTVDEKLTSTLTTRLNSSFKTVSEQLENVYKSLGEMRELSGGITTGVNSLNRIITNVKSRGTWAEVQLENILDQTIPGMYERNFASKANSKERVEFAIKIPSGEDRKDITYLPVDSKFPLEDYIRLCDAADTADAEGVEQARKALENRIISEARNIKKYINEPTTTPYAILYLATEGLYSEIASSPSGLPERIQREFNIMIAGPITITALLNTMSMGFRAVAINEKANEVRKILQAAKKQYDKFNILLDKAKQKIDEAGKTLTDAQDRNRLIQKSLKGVEEIDSEQAESILMLSEKEDRELIS